MPEAEMTKTPEGLEPGSAGWFVVNVADAAWHASDQFGHYCHFENPGSAETRFPHLGVNIHVLAPGKPACMYHRESLQEDFLVLSGECVVIIDGQERRLKAWDFVHCPPGTDHVFVGGDAPCAVLMMGARSPTCEIVYPVNDVAARHGACVSEETPDPRIAYASCTKPSRRCAPPWP